MKRIHHGRWVSARFVFADGAARWGSSLLAAIVLCVMSAHTTAKPSKVHAAFKDDKVQLAAAEEPALSGVLLTDAANQPARSAPAAVRQPTTIGGSTPQATEALPEPPLSGVVPLVGSEQGDSLNLTHNNKGDITLIVRDKPLSQVIALLAHEGNLNIVASNDIDALISITLRDVPLEQALTAILSVANYTWVKRNNIILITSLTDAANLSADVQGRQIQVFDLDFVSASAVSETITNFLSPIGKVSISASNPTNNRLTQERVVVEDLPESLERIAAYIAQIDRAPRQVLIEAHILQVNLDDTTRCGVNLSELVRLSGANFNIKTGGFANENAPQAFLATLSGGDLGGVIEMLQTTTDAKTLGSPKLLVLNEQEARLQVGEQLGFKVTTTTETSTLESVQFLDVGVVLSITPRITRDCRVLLHVKPEVSKGQVNPETGLPEEETAELETDVMLDDGEGMVIGGLIKENDLVTQAKVPYLGEVKGVGFLFRKTERTKERAEIIVALVPRIQPYDRGWHEFEQGELVKTGVPLFHGPLCRTDRPWDPILPDGKRVYRPLKPRKHVPRPDGYFHNLGPQYAVPPYPLPRQQHGEEMCETPQPRGPREVRSDPFMSEDELPLPEPTADSAQGTEIISDQP